MLVVTTIYSSIIQAPEERNVSSNNNLQFYYSTSRGAKCQQQEHSQFIESKLQRSEMLVAALTLQSYKQQAPEERHINSQKFSVV